MSDKIEIIIKPENEVDKQEVETLIRVLKKSRYSRQCNSNVKRNGARTR